MALQITLTGGIVITQVQDSDRVQTTEIEVTDAEGRTQVHYLALGEQAVITGEEEDED